MKIFYAIKKETRFLSDDNGWYEKPTLAKLFTIKEEANGLSEKILGSSVVRINMEEDDTRGGAVAMIGLIIIPFLLPTGLKIPALIMIFAPLLCRFIIPGFGIPLATIIFGYFMIWGSSQENRWWLILPLLFIYYFDYKMRKQRANKAEQPEP